MKLLLVLLVFLSSFILSQPQNPEWINYTKSEDASEIVPDGDFLWLCTHGGLVRYNKTTNEKVFYNKGNSFIPSNVINDIAIDQQGYKWVATANGVACFKDSTWIVYKTNNSGLPNNYITDVVVDSLGVKWFATRGGGLAKFNNSAWTVYTSSNSGLPVNYVLSLKLQNDTLLIGTSSGLARKTGEVISLVTNTNNWAINDIDVDCNGNIWMSTSSGVIKLFPAGNFAPMLPWASEFITIDKQNVKWIGQSAGYPVSPGLVKIDSSDTQAVTQAGINAMVPVSYFRSISLDESGTIWLGSFYGLLKVTDQTGTLIQTSNSRLWANDANGLFIDRHNRKWVYNWTDIPLSGPYIANGYLALFENDSSYVFTNFNSPVPEGGVDAVAEGPGNDVFVAFYDFANQNRLFRYSGGVWTEISIPSPLINYMWFDTFSNQLYAKFSYGNLARFNGIDWVNVNNYPTDYDIYGMLRSGDVIWICTNQGLVKYIPVTGTFTYYNNSNSGLPHNTVLAIDKDSFGNLWIGTANGLAKFTGSVWTVYNDQNSPLSCDVINSVVVDTSGLIYMSNPETGYQTPALGLIRFDGSSTWTIYNKNNSGLPDAFYSPDSNPLNKLVHNQGKIWIASFGGLSVYDRFGIPVPVELVSFSASAGKNNATLNWITATEVNNKGFEIERNHNNSGWSAIAFIPGKGTTSEISHYVYIDLNLENGKYQYRLKQIDLNGEFTYSSVVEAEIGAPENFYLFQNYPNPFNPSTKIKFVLNNRAHTILSVTDILGKEKIILDEVKDAGEYEITFDASSLSSGVYFYSLKSGDNFQIRKFIVLK